MKILYCSYSQVPSQCANSIAVMKQCDALSHVSELRVVLIKGRKKERKNCFFEYGVERFHLLRLPRLFLCFRELGLKLFVVFYALFFKPDIVYSRDLFLNECLSNFHIKNIYEMHQIDQENKHFDNHYKRVLSRVMMKSELLAIVCISKFLSDKCEVFGVPQHKLTVMHSGVDIDECNDVEKIELPLFSHKHLIAAYVGSVQKGKGVEQIVKMAKMTSHINFLIVGGVVGQINERENLKHIPRVSHKEALGYMKNADVLLLPLTEQEYRFHSPLKLFEYMAMGKPLIASDNEDVREIVVPMKNGMIADSTCPKDFLDKITMIERDMELRKQLEMNAKQSVVQYTWKERAKKIVNLIGEKRDEK